ncbi:hypothetical protein [Pendulispora rubella]
MKSNAPLLHLRRYAIHNLAAEVFDNLQSVIPYGMDVTRASES